LSCSATDGPGSGTRAARNIKLVIEYDGSGYAGWQAQRNGSGVQEAVESAIFRVTGERLRIAASGRTDAGVHARGQVATFKTESAVPAAKFAAALNAHLPEDVAVLSAEEAPEGFHARKSVKSKTYRYRILNRPARPALDRGKVYHLVPRLDVAAMRRGAQHLVGRHDFRAFTPIAAIKPGGYEREIFSLEVERRGDRVDIEVTGSGFLYNMVRCIAGTLIEVGRGRRPPEDVKVVIESRDRRRCGPTAPACGLCLVRVEYGE
jgi:tRNA pseudouridine38-40 synthase